MSNVVWGGTIMGRDALFVVSGPSGVGKDTVGKRILRDRDDIELCVSATTRAPRPGEVDGVDYHFLTHEQFAEMVGEGKFLEYQEVHGNYYGTPTSEIERIRSRGHAPLLIIDTAGGLELSRGNADVVSIFIDPPSLEVLEERLRGRATESDAQVALRLSNARKEMRDSAAYDYRVVNDDVSMCAERIGDIMDTELSSEKHVSTIVLTGGPCAGKTSAISRLVRDFTEQGWKVITVPEAATDLITNGIRPDELATVDFQTVAMCHQMGREDIARTVAQAHGNDHVLIVCDRGIMDQRAYMSDDEFVQVRQNVGLEDSSIMSRYDAIVHLRTAAYGAEDAYTLSNNEARSETPEQARQKDDQTLGLWTAHPRLHVIENRGSFGDKLDDLVAVVSAEIGAGPMRMETQRKYLMELGDESWKDVCDSCSTSQVTTHYLSVGKGKSDQWRIREVRPDNGDAPIYTMTHKVETGHGDVRLVSDKIIDKEAFDRLSRRAVSTSVKERTRFIQSGIVGSLDVWPDMPGVGLVEIRSDADEVRGFSFVHDASELGAHALGDAVAKGGALYLLEEVTDDPMFRDKAISEGSFDLSAYASELASSLEGEAIDVAQVAEPQEVEFKMLLDNIDVEALREMEGHSEISIKQTYVMSDMPGETRVREKTVDGVTTYVMTNKRDIDGGLRRIEIEQEISAEEASMMLRTPDPERSPIEKTRHVIPYDGRKIEVDVYADANRSAVAEIELFDDRAGDVPFIKGDRDIREAFPDDFPADFVADVTTMKQFKNGSLALGFPKGGLVEMYHSLVSESSLGDKASSQASLPDFEALRQRAQSMFDERSAIAGVDVGAQREEPDTHPGL